MHIARTLHETKKNVSAHLNLEELSSSFAITGGNDGSVDLYEPSVLEEPVYGHCSSVSETKNSGKDARLCPQVRKLSDIVKSVEFATLERVVL